MPKPSKAEAPLLGVIYTRVSTPQQAEEGQSIDTQFEQCSRCAERKGIEVVQHFSDPGASAWKDTGRKQFNRMIAEALSSPPPFNAIIVLDRTRFYRRGVQARILREELRRNGVKIVCVYSDFEDDGRMGSFAIAFEELNAELTSALTSDKVREGLKANARAGFHSGGNVPFGYRLETVAMRGDRAKKKLVLDPLEAAIVRDIFDRHARGLGVTLIAKQLNEEGVRTRIGGDWFKGRVAKILTDETYAGRDYFRPTDPLTGERLPREEWIEIPCPRIVDEIMFQNTQERLHDRAPNKTAPRYTSSDVLLGGIAHCGSCDSHLQIATGTSRTGKLHRYYRCAARINHGVCKGGNPVSVPEAILDDAVMEALLDQLLASDRLRAIVAKAVEKRSEAQGSANARVKQLRAELAATRRSEQNLWELAAQVGLEAAKGFREKLESIGKRKDGLTRQIADLERLLSTAIKPLSEREALEIAFDFRKLAAEAPAETRRRFVRSLVDKVTVGHDGSVRVIGQDDSVVEVASGLDVPGPPVRGSDPAWWALTGSNRRPSRCKRDALPTELTALTRCRGTETCAPQASLRSDQFAQHLCDRSNSRIVD